MNLERKDKHTQKRDTSWATSVRFFFSYILPGPYISALSIIIKRGRSQRCLQCFFCITVDLGRDPTSLKLDVGKEGVFVDKALQFNVIPALLFRSAAPIPNTCTWFLHSSLTFHA